MARHKCTKDTVKWDKQPNETDVRDDNNIHWGGTCKCGKRVYEVYVQEDGLYDATTGDDLLE
jgi:hypothetical protein